MLGTLEPDIQKHIKLNHSLYVPQITKNLISISKLLNDNNICIEFDKTCCVVKEKRRGIVLIKGVAKDGLYKLLNLPLNHSQVKSILLSSISCSSLFSVCKINKPESMISVVFKELCTSCKDKRINKTLDLWHIKLGHPNSSDLRKTMSACNISFGNKMSELSFCKACQCGKMHKLSFKGSESKSSTVLEIIHSDLWGPAPTISNQGFKYYIAFIDDKTNYTWIYGLANKSQALSAFIAFKNQIEKILELKIKTIQCDMGGGENTKLLNLTSEMKGYL